ncbi:hypothetical protein [Streptomyces montanisoli]|uniref:Uncharacterized protein n=1 Tax=Streptomyces montanisoli TaxID=2798581 RepID=A0A940MFW2_9ACTN|nr:hypothetical protein [Streptomyces montanisoli]MBP0457878.1 hypothetical protein [Streptomyces montanisoli]
MTGSGADSAAGRRRFLPAFPRLWRRAAVVGSVAAAYDAAHGGGRAGTRPIGREDEQRVLREWEVLRDRLTSLARARLADVGDLLSDARLELPGGAESAVRREYDAALEAFQAAGKILDEAVDLPDLTASVVLADRAAELFAAAHARHEGRRPPKRVVRCFYNPLHGRAELPTDRATHGKRGKGGKGAKGGGRVRVSPREAAADRRPACSSCRLAILADQAPDVLPALFTVKVSKHRSAKVFVPYYALPQQMSLWSATGCGAYDDEAPARVLRGEHRRRAEGAR